MITGRATVDGFVVTVKSAKSFSIRGDGKLMSLSQQERHALRDRAIELLEAGQDSGYTRDIWADVDFEQLRADRDRLRKVPLPTSRVSASYPRTVNRWVRVGRHFALRSFPVAQPVERDRWGRPVR